MATAIENILGKDINSLKELREEIKRLQDSIAAVDPASQEFKDTTEKLIAAQAQLASVTRATKDENVAATDSIVGMEKEYKSLYNTYKMFTEEQRNSPMGKEMEVQLNSLSKKLNETKKAVGNYKDNIGHYAESITEAFGKMGVSLGGLSAPLKLATGGVNGLNTALKANPLMLVIGLIQLFVTVVNKMKDAIQSNEDLQLRWNEAMSAFQPIADAAKIAVNAMADGFVGLIEKIAGAARWLREAKGAVTDFLGITKGAKEAAEEQNKTYQNIAKSEAALIKNKREYQKLNAKDQAEVERLREEASETDDIAKKRELLTEAKEKQAEIDARNVEIAKEELRIMQEKAALAPNSIEDNDKLAEAEAKVANAEAQAARNARTFNKALNGAKDSTSSSAEAAKKALEDLRKEAEKVFNESVENNKTELQKLEDKYQKELKLLKKFNYDTTLLTKQYEKERNDIIMAEAKKVADETRNLRNKATASWDVWGEDAGTPERLNDLKDDFKAFNEFYDKWKHVPIYAGATEESLKKAKDLVEGINIKLGTDFPFPEKTTQENMEHLDHLVFNYLQELRQKLKKAFTDDYMSQIRDSMKDRFGNVIKESFADMEKRLKAESFGNELTALLMENSQQAYNMMKAADKADDTETRLKRYEEMYKKANEFVEATANALKNNEDESLEDELTAQAEAAVDARLQIWTEYYAVLQEKRNADWAAQQLDAERTEELWKTTVDATLDGFDSIGSALDTIYRLKENQLKIDQQSGKISKQEAEREEKALEHLRGVMLAVNIASIAASTAAAIMDVWKAYAAEQVVNAETAAATGPAAAATLAALNAKSLTSAIIKSAALGTTGAAQIAAAVAGHVAGSSSPNIDNSGTAAQPEVIESNPYTYTRNVQSPEEEELNNRPIWVSVEDISSALATVKTRDEESTF